MVRKDRSLAGFDDVANTGSNNNINNNDNDNNIVNDNVNKRMPGQGPDYLDQLLEGQTKKQEMKLTGVYLQPDVEKILDKLGKQGGRGAKSRIVNEALRKLFMEKDLL